MVDLNDLRRVAATVSAAADLRDVRVFHVDSTLDRLTAGGELGYTFEAELEVQYLTDTPAVIVDGTYDVVLSRVEATEDEDAEPREGERVASINIKLAALYTVDRIGGKAPEFADSELDAFARTTGMLALHPYAREFIANLTSRMGLPTLHIATARIPLGNRSPS